MLQEKLDQQQQLKNYGRRSRKDEQGRDYVCGCGKSYLSYPALYTHIKTKHDGLRPEGTVRIGPSVLNKKNTTNIGNPPTPPNPSQIIAPPSMVKIQSTTSEIKSKLHIQILKSIEQLVKLDDLKILKEMNEQARGFTPPDNRIKRLQVGEHLYDNYCMLVKESENELSDDSFFNSYVNLTSKTPLDIVLVSYLLAVGQYVSQNMMEYYTNFGRLFYECYSDHGEQIYELGYKNNECYNQEQKQRQREKDNPQKCYEYSFPPSSSKSRSYNNLFNKQHTHSYISNTNTFANIQINIKQCKYSPIICYYFIKYFISVENDLEYYKSIIQLICNDFCLWMYRKKITVVEIGLKKKYQVLRKDMINIRDKSINTSNQYPKHLPTNVQIEEQSINKNKDNNNNEAKDKLKKKQKNKVTKIAPSNHHNNGNSNNTNNNNIKKKNNNSNINNSNNNNKSIKPIPNKNSQKTNQFLQSSQNDYNIDYKNSQNNDLNNNDEQSYKISHQICHESIGRDRSGSINQFINGHNFGEMEHQNLQENQHVAGNTMEQGNHASQGISSGGGNVDHHVNEEEIQQYFSAHKL